MEPTVHVSSIKTNPKACTIYLVFTYIVYVGEWYSCADSVEQFVNIVEIRRQITGTVLTVDLYF